MKHRNIDFSHLTATDSNCNCNRLPDVWNPLDPYARNCRWLVDGGWMARLSGWRTPRLTRTDFSAGVGGIVVRFGQGGPP